MSKWFEEINEAIRQQMLRDSSFDISEHYIEATPLVVSEILKEYAASRRFTPSPDLAVGAKGLKFYTTAGLISIVTREMRWPWRLCKANTREKVWIAEEQPEYWKLDDEPITFSEDLKNL